MFQKRTKMHLNKFNLVKSVFCIGHIHSRQPPISLKICYFSSFCNTGVIVNRTLRLYILYANIFVLFLENKIYINTYRVHVYDKKWPFTAFRYMISTYSRFTLSNHMVSILVANVYMYINSLEEWLLWKSLLLLRAEKQHIFQEIGGCLNKAYPENINFETLVPRNWKFHSFGEHTTKKC